MPEPSISCSAERRRDCCKVYCGGQEEGGSKQEFHQKSFENPRETSRRRSHICSHGVTKVFPSGDVREEGKKYDAAGNVGSRGPGAEPPVAVASHAFAREETTDRYDHYDKKKNTVEDKSHSGSNREDVEGIVKDEDAFAMERGKNKSPGGGSPLLHRHSDNAYCSGPESINNEEEAETLPDYFNLSDECGIEGAPTGRSHCDEDNPEEQHVFLSPMKKWGERQGDNQLATRYARSSKHEGSATSESEEDSDYKDISGVSDRSAFLSSPSPRRQINRSRFGRRTQKFSRRSLLTMNRINSITPSEGVLVEKTTAESEHGWQERCTSSRSKRGHQSRRQRRRSREAEDKKKLSQEGQRGSSRVDSFALGGPKSTDSAVGRRFEAEMARLRKENQLLKDSEDISKANKPNRFADDSTFRDSPSNLSRLPNTGLVDAWQQDNLAREKALVTQRLEPKRRLRATACAPYSRDAGDPPVFLPLRGTKKGSPRPGPTTWLDFVSKSHSSFRSTEATSQGAESRKGGVDLCLPRILVEGGFLWKVPYHTAGTPKRRWFQIKPAQGLLTTANGRLVVRLMGSGNGSRGKLLHKNGSSGGFSDQEGDYDVCSSLSMTRICAIWPLALIWVDPERDLRKSPPREMDIEEIVDVLRGHQTPAFWQQAAHRGIHMLPASELCLSLMGHERTLDLAADNISEAKQWARALASVVLRIRRGGLISDDVLGTHAPPWSQFEPPTMPHFPQLEDTYILPADPRQRTRGAESTDLSSLRLKKYQATDQVLSGEEPAQPYSSPPSASFPPDTMIGEGGAWAAGTIRAWQKRLFPAVMRGDVHAVQALFDQGCPVNLVQTGTGDTPLLLACRLGDIEIVGECLRRGSRNDPHPDFGQTALQAAVAAGQEACARLLLETAAPSRADAVVCNHKDPNREAPLHVACRRGYEGIVEALLHHGADIRLVDRVGNTPLHGAAEAGHAGALASLLDAGGDAFLEERNSRGDRALHLAATSGHIACVQLLLGTAAEPDTQNMDGQSPFALASIGGHLAVTRLIREYAPAAGTPSGGDAQVRIVRQGNGGGNGTRADALPRPHENTSSLNCLGISKRQTRDFEYRYVSARIENTASLAVPAVSSVKQPAQATRGGGFEGTKIKDRIFSPNEGQEGCSTNDEGHQRTPPSRQWSSRESLTTEAGSLGAGYGSSSSSAPPVHGSLFDGLQVYVVGERQPLGLQQGISAVGMSSTSVNKKWRSPTLQRQRKRESIDRTNLSSAAPPFSAEHTSTDWDGFLSAPSTVAPSPPVGEDRPESSASLAVEATEVTFYENTGQLRSIVPIKPSLGDQALTTTTPGSARALARMIHFSKSTTTTNGIRSCVDRNVRVSVLSPTAEVFDGGGSSRPARVKSTNIGEIEMDEGASSDKRESWMTSKGQQERLLSSVHNTFLGVDNQSGEEQTYAIEQNLASETRSGCANSSQIDERNRGSGATNYEGAEEKEGRGENDHFFISSSTPRGAGQVGVLTGLWRVFHSQGYPYYLHEASGHSQWNYPCCHHVSPTDTADTATDTKEIISKPTSKAETTAGDESGEINLTPGMMPVVDVKRPPASPIKPARVPVAVKVSRFDRATVPSVVVSKQDLTIHRDEAKSVITTENCIILR